MKGKWIGYSLLGLLIAGLSVYWLSPPKALPAINAAPSIIEDREIVASAIIDSLNDVIHVPALQVGTVKNIAVKVGQRVKAGQILISLDSQFAENSVLTSKITLKQAISNLKLHKISLKHLKTQLRHLRELDKRSISQVELREKMHAINMSVLQAEQLQDNVDLAKANLEKAEMLFNQYTVAAPKDGIVLQINTQLDELAGGGAQVIFLGDAQNVLVRVSLDERDIHEFNPNAAAYLTHNEHPGLKIPLTFMRLNQYIVVQERLNSRVQEVIYSFNRDAYSGLVAGQQFDAHISVKKS